ncbi:MAG: Rrf2 family transcriptional regulator [candidate division KSB1 bacterium]|nr:Rrf2 family transcriptional regulator [candidate division KSB1 bacterium]MDZ7305209.1 Rrf2 family transcriptional regulator [candidate division KSB1 bacterium]MDZ7314320.1 Rrf2 family transcriptional regulator [candidate division KSB1 bacterium]
MGLIFSRQCEYALQAVLYLALQPPGKMITIKELAKRLDIPSPFLAKILQSLTYKRLLTSMKGPAGGFALAMPAKDITLFHIVEAIDGRGFFENCVLGFPECSGKNPCSVHEKWGVLRQEIYDMLRGRSIAQTAKEMKKPRYRSSGD